MPAEKTKPFLRVLAGEDIGRSPFWFMRQAGRYLPEYREIRATAGGFLELCYQPDFATEVTLQPIRRYGMDAAILFSDILVIPHALGQDVGFTVGEGPKLEPLRSATDLEKLSLERLHGALEPVYQTVSALSSALPSDVALIGFAGAPWTVATYMVEGSGSKEFGIVKKMMMSEPELFGRLIDLLVTATTAYLAEQVRRGAEVIQLFDSWAGALDEVAFQKWVIAPTARIVAALRAEFPDLPVIGFPRSAGILYKKYASETKVTGLSIDTSVPATWAAQELAPLAIVQGNLDPVSLVAGGEAMMSRARALCETFRGRRHIFNLGHGILQTTPPEHVAMLSDYLRSEQR
jgi:uroporphyrinogen decarboxylase